MNSQKVIIGITGELLAGKSYAADYFESKFNAKRIKISKILDLILGILDLPATRENEANLGSMLRSVYGREVLAVAAMGSVNSSAHNVYLIDGIRKIEEIQELKRNKNFKLIFITAPLEVRFNRMKTRKEKPGEENITLEQFKASENSEADRNLKELKEYADFTVENNGNILEFESKLAAIFTKLL